MRVFVGIVYWMTLAVVMSACGDDQHANDAAVDAAGDAPVDVDLYPAECGNHELDPGEVCDDGDKDPGDGCSADCMSDERCGNRIIDMITGELCDDGNTRNGDGCSADCRSDERCGNGTVDLGVGEVCDDGNQASEDGCSADCRTGPTCGDRAVHPPEACDDGNQMPGDGCNADCTSNEQCGNGALDPGELCDDDNVTAGDDCSPTCHTEVCGNSTADAGEDCDDGNDVDGDGCDVDCTYSCSPSVGCDDGNPCTGAETCDETRHRCLDAADLVDGATCGGGSICRAGACVTPGCGDRTVDALEDCDDGNTTDGDGCDNNCRYSCTADAGCADGNACNGDESCVIASHTCRAAPSSPAEGSLCERDADPGTRDICRASTCVASRCGDGFHDVAVELCDDGNATPGDGCEPSCAPTGRRPTSFRMTRMSIREPHLYTVLFICSDITSLVSGDLNNNIADFSINYQTVFRPLDLGAASTAMDFVDGECTNAAPLDDCGVGAGTVYPTQASNIATGGTCFDPAMAPWAAVRNPAYTPPNTVSGPCFTSEEETINLDMGGVLLPLEHAQIAATYSGGTPPTALVSGVVRGFVSQAAAEGIIIPAGTALVGGQTLYSLLADGPTGDSCRTNRDDSDTLPDGTPGFWFFVDFTAEVVNWTGP